MSKASKLYNKIYSTDLFKIRKCAESVQTRAQFDSF